MHITYESSTIIKFLTSNKHKLHLEIIVDTKNLPRIIQVSSKWCAIFSNGKLCNITAKQNGKTISLGKLILGCFADHIDRNPLNNLESNLREATQKLNMANRSQHRNNTTGLTGVSWSRADKVYKVNIYDDKPIYLGRFKDKIEAAKAYDKKCLELRGEFAVLNFPIEKES